MNWWCICGKLISRSQVSKEIATYVYIILYTVNRVVTAAQDLLGKICLNSCTDLQLHDCEFDGDWESVGSEGSIDFLATARRVFLHGVLLVLRAERSRERFIIGERCWSSRCLQCSLYLAVPFTALLCMHAKIQNESSRRSSKVGGICEARSSLQDHRVALKE